MSTIFWSWQSDLDARVTRQCIRDALASAISDLNAELEERHELTSDTQGVAGTPDIVSTILEKIDASAVFVGDVTPIAESASGKAVANPNVLIELGYAKKSLGLNRVILVWNTAMEAASIDKLPFDMRGRRAPISFHLPENSPTQDLRVERDKLRDKLREALIASLGVANPVLVRELNWQPAHRSTAALWFDPAEELKINEDGEPGSKLVHAGPHAYVRIVPTHWSIPDDFLHGEQRARLLGRSSGYSWGSSKGGVLVYSGSIRSQQSPILSNIVIQFRETGEIWGVTSHTTSIDGKRFFADTFISNAHNFIEANLAHLIRQGAGGPFEVRIGATNLAGLSWISETGWGGNCAALEDEKEVSFALVGNSEAERLETLEQAWGEFTSAFGIMQPPRSTLVRQIKGF